MKKNTQKNNRHKQSFHSHALRESESGAGNSNFSVETKIAEKIPERKLHADERIFSLSALANELGISQATVCSMVGDGMPCVRGKRRGVVLFREAEVREWLARRPKVEVNVPEIGEDGVAAGTDRAGVVVAGVMFLLMAAGIIFGAVMAITG